MHIRILLSGGDCAIKGMLEWQFSNITLLLLVGCEPSVFYLLARHGSRYPNSDTIVSMNDTLPGFQDIVTSSGKRNVI